MESRLFLAMSPCEKYTQVAGSFQAHKTPCSCVAAEIRSAVYPESWGLWRFCKDSAAWSLSRESVV